MFRVLLPLLALLPAVLCGMYSDAVVSLDPSNFDKLVMQSSETWLVKFYAPWCGHCKSSAPAFSKAAQKLNGVARLGVINCDDHQQLAQRFSIQGFPTIKVFKGTTKKERRPSDYNQPRTSKAFIDHVKYVMPSFVARVKQSGLDAFFGDLKNLPHVLLFTDKTTTSPLYKGLSARFRNRIALGEVRKADASEMVKKYNVKNYPTLIAFKAGESEIESATPFQGKLDPNNLIKFFDSIAVGNVTDAGVSEEEEEKPRDQSEKTFAQPKAYSGEIYSIGSTKEYETNCDARADGRMCGLVLMKGDKISEDDLKPIAEKFQYDNMAFATIDIAGKGAVYADLFGIDKDKGAFLVMRARKRKYSLMTTDLSADAITTFLDRVVGGDARWTKLKDELPAWEADKVEGEAKEGESSENAAEEGGEEDGGQCGTEPPKDGETCGKKKEAGEKEDL